MSAFSSDILPLDQKHKVEEEPDYKKIALLALHELRLNYYGSVLQLNGSEMREAFDGLFRTYQKTTDGQLIQIARTIESEIEPDHLPYLNYIVALDANPELTYKTFCQTHMLVMNDSYAEDEEEEEEADDVQLEIKSV